MCSNLLTFTVIELKNLQKLIGQSLAIDLEALNVEAGEIAALVWPVRRTGR